MKTTTPFQPVTGIVLALISSLVAVAASTVTWDGGGDGRTWSDPMNWDGDYVPARTNDVVIPASGGGVVHTGGTTEIRSLQCDRDFELAGGTVRLTGGDSAVNGMLTLAPRATLTVTGAGVTFTSELIDSLGHVRVYAREGARISLPNVHTYAVDSPQRT